MAEVLILPGLDGTATLHGAFSAALRDLGIDSRSIDYPTDRVLDYSQLAELVISKLPTDRPFVLLGESFSGPVAILVAASDPKGLVGLVLSTSFASAPVSHFGWMARLTRFAPARLPSPLVSWLLFGRWGSRKLVERVQAAISSVRPPVLRARVAIAMRADVTNSLDLVRVPTLILRAKQDRLLLLAPIGGLDQIQMASTAHLDGPHLLLQTQAGPAAQLVASFARSVGV